MVNSQKKKRNILFHLNDSKDEKNSYKDRHESLFQGKIPKQELNNIIEYIIENKFDCILETPTAEEDFKNYFKPKKDFLFVGITYSIQTKNNLNEDLANFLLTESEKEKNAFKKNAIKTGSEIISNLDFEVHSSEDLIGINGIGEGIRSRVDDFFEKPVSEKVYANKIYYSQVKEIENKFKSIFGNNSMVFAGSYRRGKENVGDIDIIIKNEKLTFDDILRKLKEYKVESKGTKKMTIIYKRDIQIDFVKTTKESFPFTLLYFTGSRLFNIQMRKRAKDMGYKLNEYGIFKNNKRLDVNITTEKQIFEFFKMDYLKPSERNI